MIFVRNFIPTSARPLVKWKEETSLALHILCLRVNAHDNEQLGNNVVFWDFVGCCICRVFFGGGGPGANCAPNEVCFTDVRLVVIVLFRLPPHSAPLWGPPVTV